MLSQSAEYSLRAVVALAHEEESSLTTKQIAERTQVPVSYLSKILQSLGRAGLVAAQRGLGGGFRLARPAASMSILEVVNVVAPVQRISGCPLHKPEHRKQLCSLHSRLDAAYAHVEQALAATTVAELVQAPACCRPFGAARAGRRRKRR